MKFIDYTNQWIKGELFEAKLIVGFAILIIAIALLFYYIGTTLSAKALLFPLLVVGLLYLIIGGGMLYSNPKRTIEFKEQFEKKKTAFIKSEKERVETFTKWYPTTRWIMAVIGVLGIAIFIFWETPLGRAIGIALILATLSTFVIDHFSEERAEIYYKQIINQ